MRNFYSAIFILFFVFATCQKAQYFEFAYDYLYGIVDKDGNEIIAPAYDWKMYTLDNRSPFIALISSTKDALIFNIETGKSENLKYISGAYVVNINNDEFIYAYNDNDAFLMNNRNLDSRINLSKKYVDLRDEGDYLIGYTKENNLSVVDIISKNDFKIKKENLFLNKIHSYKTEDDKIVYVVNQPLKTLFLDENLEAIGNSVAKINNFEDAKKFLATKNKIHIMDTSQEIAEIATGAGYDYPFIKLKGTPAEVTCVIYTSGKDFTPVFTFKKGNFKLQNSSFDNSITFVKEEKNRVFTYILFHVDPFSKTVLLPKKYWIDIDLQLITENSK